jgi:Zn-dependent protease
MQCASTACGFILISAYFMLLGEPPPTQADLHLRLFGFPVRVHPFFWVVILLLGLNGDKLEPVSALVWVAVVFVSVLIHELGHAFLQRKFGGRPWIVLHGFGGLSACNDCDRSPRSQIIISLAGPMAGFLLAAVLVIGIRLAGHGIRIVLLGNDFIFDGAGFRWNWTERFLLYYSQFVPFSSATLNLALYDLLFVNIMWGLLNLLPIYPLDGGQIARELFTLGNPRRGIVQSLQLSIGTAVLVAVYALLQSSIYLCLMFGFLAYGSYQALQSYQNHWR